MKVWKVAKLMETERESGCQELGGRGRGRWGSAGIKFQFSRKKGARERAVHSLVSAANSMPVCT